VAIAGDGWTAGGAYEAYMGRWSRAVAGSFVDWLRLPESAHWLDFGCGTGALTATICERAAPASVTGCDPSQPFVEYARGALAHLPASFAVATSESLPSRDGGFDAVVSGLVLNFVPAPAAVLRSLRGRVRPGGTVAAYVWDYAEGMEFLAAFWAEAVAGDPGAAAVDERRRFPLCDESALRSLFEGAGLTRIDTRTLEIPTVFAGFGDFWAPFLRGTGPAPSYVATLEIDAHEALRERLRRRLPADADGRIRLRARALAVRGLAP
jgi:SAM-dependent methyltransferase